MVPLGHDYPVYSSNLVRLFLSGKGGPGSSCSSHCFFIEVVMNFLSQYRKNFSSIIQFNLFSSNSWCCIELSNDLTSSLRKIYWKMAIGKSVKQQHVKIGQIMDVRLPKTKCKMATLFFQIANKYRCLLMSIGRPFCFFFKIRFT